MLQTLPIAYRRIVKAILPALMMLFVVNDTAGQCAAWPYPVKGTFRPNITPNIGNGYYDGLVEYLPTDYADDPTKKYPLIVFFHGQGGYGDGSSTQLCRIISDFAEDDPGVIPTHLINHIERGTWGSDLVPTVGSTSFIVIAPQAREYLEPFNYSDQTDLLLDYLVSHYRVDMSRIYLTGFSYGAGHVVDYLSSSVEHAQRIAAGAIGASCFKLEFSEPNGPQNIANGGVATWFTICTQDADEFCGIQTHNDWVNAINSFDPVKAPRLDVWSVEAPGGTPYPQSLGYCRSYEHDAWSALHNPDFEPSDGGSSLYAWFLTHTAAAALPVTLKSFSARLSNGKVYLRWVTSSEQENHGFVIERAGANGAYAALTQVGGGGNSSGDKVYEYVDENPLTNLSFYRLKQQDLSGRFRFFEARKVMNKGRFKSMILITPNPFSADPSAFISVDKRQKVTVWLSDMSGRILSSVNGVYEEGTTELSLPTGSLPRGVYFVKVAGENVTETHKIIKQ